VFSEVIKERQKLYATSLIDKVLRKLKLKKITDPLIKYNILDYQYAYSGLRSLNSYNFKIFPALVPGWDNSARRKNDPTLIYTNSTPAKFKQWLKSILIDFKPYSVDESFVFINAWNEWAEGNHLEPCQKWGVEYLTALRDQLQESDN
jgi:hypothetical protein